jgi:DNA polymerase-3 subunit delta
MAVKAKQALDPLADGFASPLLPVYLVYGNEHSEVARAAAKLVELALDGEPTAGNVTWLEGGETTGQEIRSQASTIPFLTPKRVVVVRNANDLRTDAQNALAPHVGSLPETTCLILDVRSAKTEHGLSTALAKAVREAGAVYEYAQADLRSDDLPNRVQQLAAQQGKSISKSSCHFLLQRTGTELGLIQSEIAKLAAYVEPAKAITNADIDAMTPKSVEESVFQLTDAVTEGKLSAALEILDELLTQGEAPEMILTMLLRQFQLLRQAKFLLGQGLRLNAWQSLPEEVQARLPQEHNVVKTTAGRMGWLAKKLVGQCQRLSSGQLNDAPRLLLNADLQLKGADGQARDRRVTMETLLCQLCPGPASGRSF